MALKQSFAAFTHLSSWSHVVAIGSMAILTACGGDSGSKSSGAEDVPVREVSTIYDLGACTPDREGDTVYVTAQSIDYLCSGNNWLDITTLPENPDPAQSSSSIVPGNDPESSSSTVDDPLNGGSSSSARTSYIEVTTREQLGTCDASLIGLRALVLADSTYFTCKANGWTKDEIYPGYDIVPAKENLPQCHAGNAKQRVLVKKDSVFFKCDSVKWVPETADGYIVKNASILGAAQKGPFKFNSPLTLREVLLHDDALTYTGREYIDEISSNKGDFVIPKVNLVYPYAVLEVRGLWRNEVTGEWSKDSMTLRALTDLTSRTEVNINLLTHLEYDRAVQLVNKGYSVFAAKKQAKYEIMTAFGFATTVEYSEDLKTFVPSTSENYGENATLMAISLLFIGDRSEAEIQNAINSFKSDLAEDGEWDNGQMKADMADWAEAFDGGSVRANVKSWNILDIPDYENYLTIYWNNAYELGGCSATRSGVIVQNKNSMSKNYNVHYICKVTSWQKATDFEKDTYQWAEGKEGEVKKGNVTATYYVFENGKWTVAKNETALGLCTASRNGEVGKIDTTYFICENKNWRKATVLEYDTYQFGAGNDGEVRIGKVNEDKYYVYENGAWRASASEIENNLGACVTSRLNEVGKSGNTYYTCKTSGWTKSTTLEYDTYGWEAGTEGAVKPGSVNTSNHYVFENGAWRASKNDVEYNYGACVTIRENEKHPLNGKYYICENKAWKEISATEYGLGYCITAKNGVVEKLNEVYYICKSEKWNVATVLEYDTYGWTAGTEGEIKAGSVNANNYYIYKDGKWQETSIGTDLGLCNSDKDGFVGVSGGVYYICKTNSWNIATMLEYDTYGWTVGTEGEVKAGNVNTGNYYIYKDSEWQAASSVEKNLGGCTTAREGEVDKSENTYYICKSKTWKTATVLEYDTYGWTAGTEGEVRVGNVNTSKYYIYKNSKWQAASSVEKNLGGCTTAREGEVDKSENTYYICKSKTWKTATVLEYDTYGKACLTNGSIVSGEVTSTNKYVCDAGAFRAANEQEISLNKGCVSYTEGNEIRKQLSSVTDSVYLCDNDLWKKSIEFAREYGTLTDERDGKTYKTVVIGTQTWMAENLNYSDSTNYPSMKGRNWCYENKLDSCSKYGRLYTWSAAMDSAGTFSSRGKGCGYGKICSPTYPVRGICPSGWHLSTKAEFEALFTNVGGKSTAAKMLKSTSGWKSNGNGEDAFGFSALPAGYYDRNYFDNDGNDAYFWSSTEYDSNYAYGMNLYYSNPNAFLYGNYKNYGFSVRCVKD
ncbi:fibrobacter succinogenes major paralogous domain-containing protein [uncultured Fibrobacter sp.]|uniref:fibrobacter succinogenes major paralogous domain-containing protein n=1 Tax=uncultured Fibrobacter sp. TaxID=261512 RepID=UPI0025E65B81|nr:fibrobacter succinogenes major paralogous domain-containing protein [uncultured Fibrobacter sp.]